jgi:lipopolysaccharide/colanic/teichoic acid biosynthesis glycosyltransferase
MNEPAPIKVNLLKIGFDKCFSLILVATLSPIWLLIMVCIWIEMLFSSSARGPVFYTETRITQGAKFQFFKFRIFKIKSIEKMASEKGFIATKELEKNPKNLTIVGKVLKKYYLDELPQIWNILKGDMSFVGTRPWNVNDYNNEIKRGIFRKKIMRAGLVGPVQVNKGKWHIKDQWSHDNEYIKKCRESNPFQLLFYDIFIIARSVIVMFQGKGL